MLAGPFLIASDVLNHNEARVHFSPKKVLLQRAEVEAGIEVPCAPIVIVRPGRPECFDLKILH